MYIAGFCYKLCDQLSVILSESLTLEHKIIFENLKKVSENLLAKGVVETEFKNEREYLIVRNLSGRERELHESMVAKYGGDQKKAMKRGTLIN